MTDIKNLFSNIPANRISEEFFEDILNTEHFRIEKIVSDGDSSPEGFWYDQNTDEWVILIQGSAGLLFEGSDETVILKPGDYLNIPAHTRHRVEWTDPDQKSVWIAVHYKNWEWRIRLESRRLGMLPEIWRT